MGRNADKRRARKTGGSTSGEGVAVEDAAAGPDTKGLEKKGPDKAGDDKRRAAADRPLSLSTLEIPHDADGSVARALFRITCLLSVRDGRGVPAESLQRAAEEIAQIVEADAVSLFRLETGDDVAPTRLVLMGAHGIGSSPLLPASVELGDGIAGRVASTGQVVRVEDAPRDPRFTAIYGKKTTVGSLLAVPLSFKRRLLGVLTVSRREIRAFSERDEERLAFVADAVAQDLEQARLLFDAVMDPLTGLHSRLSLLLALPREVDAAKRYRSELSLLLLDVDGLSEINRTQGRVAGDRVLIEAAARLRTALRGSDLPVRLGADELAVLLPSTSSNNARTVAKRLARALSEPLPALPATPGSSNGAELRQRWSIGTATLGPDEDAVSLLWRCDEALADAKAKGGDRIVTAPVHRPTR
jgi:diguanylate cyclase (GGDEF)-like protein